MTPLVVDPSGYLKPHHSVGHCHLLGNSPRAHQQRSQADHGHPFGDEEPLKLGLIAGRDTRNRTRVRSHYYLRCATAVICCRTRRQASSTRRLDYGAAAADRPFSAGRGEPRRGRRPRSRPT